MRNIERYTEQYMKENISGFENYQIKYRRKKVLEILDRYHPLSLVEIGCGMEPIGLYYTDFDEYTLYEPSEDFFNNAVARFLDHRPDEKLNDNRRKTKRFKSAQGGMCTFYNIPFSKEVKDEVKQADFIICSSLLHEVENPDSLLRDIHNFAKSQTIVHVNVPNAYSLHRRIAQTMGLIEDVHDLSERNIDFQQNTVFDLSGLKAVAERAGFEIIDEGSYFLKPFAHSQMTEIMKSEIIGEDVLDGMYETGKTDCLGSEIYINMKKRH